MSIINDKLSLNIAKTEFMVTGSKKIFKTSICSQLQLNVQSLLINSK